MANQQVQELLIKYRSDVSELQAKVSTIESTLRKVDVAAEQSGKKIKEGLDKGTEGAKRFQQEGLNPISNGLQGIGTTIIAAFSVQQLFAFGQAAVHAFQEAELNAKKLQTAVVNIGQEGETAFQLLIDQSARLQEASIFSDDDIQRAQTQLIQFGLTSTEVENLVPKILDLASAQGIDLASATDTVIQGINGQTRALKPLGLEFKNTGDKAENLAIISDKLGRFTGQTSAVLGTAAGKAKNLGNQFDDLKEKIGGFIQTNFGNPIAREIGKLFEGNLEQVNPLTKINEQFNLSIETLKRLNPESQTRRDLIKQINDNYGSYLPKLLTEKASLDEITKAQEEGNKQILGRIILQTQEAEITKIVTNAAKAQESLIQIEQQRTALNNGLAQSTLERKTRLEQLNALEVVSKALIEKSRGDLTALRDKYSELATQLGINEKAVSKLGLTEEEKARREGDQQKKIDDQKRSLKELQDDADKAAQETKVILEKQSSEELQAIAQSDEERLKLKQEGFEKEKQQLLQNIIDQELIKAQSAGVTEFRSEFNTETNQTVTIAVAGDKDAVEAFNQFVKEKTDGTNAEIKASRIKTEQEIIKALADLNTKREKDNLTEIQAVIDKQGAERIRALNVSANEELKRGANFNKVKEKLDRDTAKIQNEIAIQKDLEVINSASSTVEQIIAAKTDLVNRSSKLDKTFTDNWIASFTAISSVAQDFFDSFDQIRKNDLDTQVESLNERRDSELATYDKQQEDLDNSHNKKLISDREFEKRSADIKTRRIADEKRINDEINKVKKNQAEAERALALFNIAINIPEAITKLEAQLGIGAAIAIPIAIALGIAQAAAVLSAPIPAFEKGTKSAPGGLSIVGERGIEMMYVPPTAKILPNQQTKDYSKVFDAMYDRRFEKYVFDSYTLPALKNQKIAFEQHKQETFAQSIANSFLINQSQEGIDEYGMRRVLAKGVPITNIEQLAEAIAQNTKQYSHFR